MKVTVGILVAALCAAVSANPIEKRGSTYMTQEQNECHQQHGCHWSSQDNCCYDQHNNRWSKDNWGRRKQKCSSMHYSYNDNDKCCYSRPHNQKWWFDDQDCQQGPQCWSRQNCEWDDLERCCYQLGNNGRKTKIELKLAVREAEAEAEALPEPEAAPELETRNSGQSSQCRQEQQDCQQQQGCHWDQQEQCCYDHNNKRWSKNNWQSEKQLCSKMHYDWDDNEKCCYSKQHHKKWYYDDQDCQNAPPCYNRNDCQWSDQDQCCYQHQGNGQYCQVNFDVHGSINFKGPEKLVSGLLHI